MQKVNLACPAVSSLLAPASWQALDFISDLHLSAQTPLTFKAWCDYMRTTCADAVFILGDLIEVWVGDDARFDGFEAELFQALSEFSQLRPTYFMAGNRDFLVGPEMLQACGMLAMPDPTCIHAFGQRGLFVHGDELCLSDVAYQKFRLQVRQPSWQAAFLMQPLAKRRLVARELRDQSELHQKIGRGTQAAYDVDRPTALNWLTQSGAAFLVHGHTHLPGTDMLDSSHVRHVLSDWDLEQTPPRAQVLRWTPQGMARV